MTTQTEIIRSIVYFFIGTSQLSGPSYDATSLDYGFDFDDQSLGQELAAPLPAGDIADSPAPLIEADEFESLYKWFIS